MPRSLGVWYRGALAGSLLRDGETVSFTYDSAYSGPPLSLSLPLGGPHTKKGALHYIENLLPDNPRVRRRWSQALGVRDAAFDILEFMGEDVAGAFSILPDGVAPQARDDPLVAVDEDELHFRAASIQNDEDSWVAAEQIGKVRMSLAGAQGKFSLIFAGGLWFYPTVNAPSTHIFKPAPKRFAGIAPLEAGSLALASEVGIAASRATVADYGSYKGTFVAERFDRLADPVSGQVHRVHAEDFAQAHGRTPGDKYAIPAHGVVAMLRDHASEEDSYRFVEMLALNVAIGNADAHGKNYSVLFDESGKVSLAPMYDTVPTAFYPDLDRTLGMKVGRAKSARAVELGDWRTFAKDSRLDDERVITMAAKVHRLAEELARDAYSNAGVTGRDLDRITAVVSERTGNLRKLGVGDGTGRR
jgi:serine/threonine-protein kinase HipA